MDQVRNSADYDILSGYHKGDKIKKKADGFVNQLDFCHIRKPDLKRQMFCNKTDYKKYGCENQLLYCELVLFFAMFVVVGMSVFMTATAGTAAMTMVVIMVVMTMFVVVALAVLFMFIMLVMMSMFVVLMVMFMFMLM